MNREMFKKTGEELQAYLRFKRKGFKVKTEKGKGSFRRKAKHNKKSLDEE